MDLYISLRLSPIIGLQSTQAVSYVPFTNHMSNFNTFPFFFFLNESIRLNLLGFMLEGHTNLLQSKNYKLFNREDHLRWFCPRSIIGIFFAEISYESGHM